MARTIARFIFAIGFATSAVCALGQITESVGEKVFRHCDQQRLFTQLHDLKFALGEAFIREDYLTQESTAQRAYDVAQCQVLEAAVEELIVRVLEGEKGYQDADFASVGPGHDAPVAFAACGDSLHHAGTNYSTHLLGNRCWMGEALRTVNYTDGTPLPELRADSDWAQAEGPGWSVYDGLNRNAERAGLLYNGLAAMTDMHLGLCPVGWEVARKAYWVQAAAVFQGDPRALKSERWDGTGRSGLDVMPGGFRDGDSGAFASWGSTAAIWTSDAGSIVFSIASGALPVTSSHQNPTTGASVWCVKQE